MKKQFFSLSLAAMLAGCGLTPPEVKEAWDGDVAKTPSHGSLSGSAVLEFEIEKKVYCELKEAVIDVEKEKTAAGDNLERLKPTRDLPIDPSYIAELSLSLEVDESTALNPGIAINRPLPNYNVGFGGNAAPSAFQQLFSVGLGGTLSQTGSTFDKYDPFWTIAFLRRENLQDSICKNPQKDLILTAYAQQNGGDIKSSPFLLDGNLGIEEWLKGAVLSDRILYSVGKTSDVVGPPGASPPTALTHEIKFVVVTSGNINPSWKLVKVSANTGMSPLFGVSRTRTHDLIITIGPNKQQTTNTFFASQLGLAVSNGTLARTMQ